MPNNPFKFKVSTIKPTVVLFAKPFLKEPIKKILRKKGISIRSPKTAEKEKNIDYVVDATKSNKAISLAQKQKAKYLAISQDLNEEFNFKDINARILRTDFLVGPKMQIKTPLGQMLTAAVKNEEIPIPKGKNIFPLHVQDLARAVWQALVMPNTMNKEFLVLGLPTTLGHISEALILLGQTTKGASKDSNLEIINYSQKKLKEAFNLLDWQPSLEPSQALEKAFFSLISDPRLKKNTNSLPKD